MSHVPELKPADKWIFAMAAFALVSIIVGTRLAHTHHEILGDVFFFLGFSTLFALPSVAGLHIIFNDSRSSTAILRVESILVCILLMLAAAFSLLPLFTRPHTN